MPMTPEKENLILKEMLKVMFLREPISILETSSRIVAAAEYLGETPEDIHEIISPILKEAINESLDPKKLEEAKKENEERKKDEGSNSFYRSIFSFGHHHGH